MKARILIVLLWLLVMNLGGCKSSRLVVDNIDKVEQEVKEDKVKFDYDNTIDMSKLVSWDKDRMLDFIFYDTNKPIDINTGKPPILAEGSLSNKDKINTEINSVVKENLTTEIDSSSDSKIIDNSTHKDEVNKKSKVEQWGLLFKWIAVLVGVILVVYLIFRAREKIKM